MQRGRFGLALERGWHARDALETHGRTGRHAVAAGIQLGLSRKTPSACERVVRFRDCPHRGATGGRFGQPRVSGFASNP